MMHWGWSWWALSGMWLGMLAFWVLVVWAIYSLVAGGARGDDAKPAEDARAILDARLARGEVELGEYQQLRGAMTEHDTSVGRAQ